MTMDEILENVITLAENDQSITDTSVIAWTNMAINRINVAVKANIPLVSDVGAITPAFDVRYHEALVLFCVAKYREGDSAYSDAGYFMNQFNEMLNEMQRDMEILPSMKLDNEYQQITVTDGTITSYPLSMPYGSYFDVVDVFKNDKLLNTSDYRILLQTRMITVTGTPLVKDDKITVHYQNNSDLNNPPYGWWGNSGW